MSRTKRELDVEARYWQLLQSGMGIIDACWQVGITRKAGHRWRAEVGDLVPVRLAEKWTRTDTCPSWSGSESPHCSG
jgi:hypothetical protein